jgi:hypothetical protein
MGVDERRHDDDGVASASLLACRDRLPLDAKGNVVSTVSRVEAVLCRQGAHAGNPGISGGTREAIPKRLFSVNRTFSTSFEVCSGLLID